MRSLWKTPLFFQYLQKWKNIFGQYVQNYQHFKEMALFWDHFEKMVFCTYLRKYKISRQMYVPLDFFEQIVVGPYVQKYQHFENIVFWPYPEQGHFCEIPLKNSRRRVLFFRFLRKSFFFCTYVCPKISKFRGKESYFQITLKKSIFDHISENIKIQGS